MKENTDFLSTNLMISNLISQASGNVPKVFDWDKAAKILKERKIKNAEAGLKGDWLYTHGTILKNGNPVLKITPGQCMYLYSNHAIPQLKIKSTDGDENIDCFIDYDEKKGWKSDTIWPESSINIFYSN